MYNLSACQNNAYLPCSEQVFHTYKEIAEILSISIIFFFIF